jgi:hypothetical protein
VESISGAMKIYKKIKIKSKKGCKEKFFASKKFQKHFLRGEIDFPIRCARIGGYTKT